jgi:transcriptional regulator with XRE-family HTH domain
MTLIRKKLTELRLSNHLRQDDVAKFLGVARTTYAMYEQGNREMDYALLLKLADYYKVSLDYLFGRSDIPVHHESYTEDEIEFMVRSLDLYKEMKSKL